MFFFLALICEIIGTIGGFGSSVFFVPLASFFFDFKTVLVITALLHVFSNTAKLFLFSKHINYRLTLLFGIPSVIMVILGAWLATRTNFTNVDILLGSFLILFSIFFLLSPSTIIKPTKLAAISGGGIAGFVAGIFGTGGAIRGTAMTAFNLEKNTFIATSAAVDLGVDLSRSVIYLDSDFLSKDLYGYIAALFFIAFIGSYIGKVILKKISQEYFRRIVLFLILGIGAVMVINYFFDV